MSYLPAIGETIHVHGGTITRRDDNRFQVWRASGRSWHGHQRCNTATVSYISILNRLRQDVGMEKLPLPCAYCGDKPRIGTTPYCSRKCVDDHNGITRRAWTPIAPAMEPFTSEQKTEAYEGLNSVRREHGEAFDMAKALDTLHRIAPPLRGGLLPDTTKAAAYELNYPTPIQDGIEAVRAVIEKRRHAYAILDDCLRRAQHRQLVKREQAS